MSDHDPHSVPPPPPPPPAPPVAMPTPPTSFARCVLCGAPRADLGARCPDCGLHPGLATGDPDPLGRPGATMILGSLAAIYLVVFGIVAATN